MSKNNREGKGSQETAMGAALAGAMEHPVTAPGGTVETVSDGEQAIIDDMTTEQKVFLDLLGKLYGEVECQSVDNAVSEKFGRKSVAAIEVMVPFPLLGLKVPLTLWARLVNTAEETKVIFEASLPRGMKSIDDGGERLKAYAENKAAEWGGYDKATDAAVAKLLGQKAPQLTGRPELSRPTLVKQIKIQSQQQSSTAAPSPK